MTWSKTSIIAVGVHCFTTQGDMLCVQANDTVKANLDVHALFRPILSGISRDMPTRLVPIDSKVSTTAGFLGSLTLLYWAASLPETQIASQDTVRVMMLLLCGIVLGDPLQGRSSRDTVSDAAVHVHQNMHIRSPRRCLHCRSSVSRLVAAGWYRQCCTSWRSMQAQRTCGREP